MYVPFMSHGEPSNRERRTASVVSVIGFGGFAWMILMPPGDVTKLLCGLALILAVLYLGLGTLSRAGTARASIWRTPDWLSTLQHRMGWGNPGAPLDERDEYVRHRLFLVCYRILAVALLALFVAIDVTGMVANRVSGSLGRLDLYDWVIRATVLFLSLSLLLPHWVLPWLDPQVAPAEEGTLAEDTRAQNDGDMPGTGVRPDGVRLLGNVAFWLLFAVWVIGMLWLFNKQAPGGLVSLFH